MAGKNITCIGKRWYFVMRVPACYRHLGLPKMVRQSLHTNSETQAAEKAAAIKAEYLAAWEAKAAGQTQDAARRLEAAQALCKARGYTYRPLPDLLQPERLDDFINRVVQLADLRHLAPSEEVEATLGLAEPPQLTLSAAMQEFFGFSRDRLIRKSDVQVARWKQPRLRAVENFAAVVGDKAIEEITRQDVEKFRNWWIDRVTSEGRNPETANKIPWAGGRRPAR